MDAIGGLQRKLSAEELTLLHCGIWENSWVSWTARRSNQSILKEISPEYSLKVQMLSWSSSTLATWCEELTDLKRPWCWERLKEGGEGDNRGWDGWMASPTQRAWVWVNSGSSWWTERPGMSMVAKSQTRLSEWTELNWSELNWTFLENSLITHIQDIENVNIYLLGEHKF